MHKRFGPLNWWPARTRFEVIIGAVLTQNTAWSNVEKAIKTLKNEQALSLTALRNIKTDRLAQLIKPSGYYNQKAIKLKNTIRFIDDYYCGSLRKMAAEDTAILRERLLCVKGIGPETADSILLYALKKPVFVIDAYTKRIFSRHGFCGPDIPYEELQRLFMDNLEPDYRFFNEYHALLVNICKYYCKKSKPDCENCPLSSVKSE